MRAIKALLLVGGPYHDRPGMRRQVVEAIQAHGGADLTTTDDRGILGSPELSQYDAVVVYTTGGKLTPVEERGLTQFVASGKGLVGIHGANTSFNANPSYVDMIGSRFLRHPPFADVTVEVLDPDHPITRGIGAFTVPDELYVLECDLGAVHLLATARIGNEAQPSVYTKSWGDGRVVYVGLGHDNQCLSAEPFRLLAGRGLRWSVGRLES